MSRSTSMFACVMVASLLCCDAATAAPKIVQQLAKSYATAHSDADKIPSHGRTVMEEYEYWFFQGFIHPNGGIYTKVDIDRNAYIEGQAYLRNHPDERDAIFSGYGYVHAKREGVLSQGYELSTFTPLDGEAEEWWFGPLGDGEWSALRPGQPEPIDKALVRVEGYLSSAGRYGHLGAYRREILVTSFTFLHR